MKRTKDDNKMVLPNKPTFEKYDIPNVVEIEVDLDSDVIKEIDRIMNSGGYVSRNEVIRDLLRRKMRGEGPPGPILPEFLPKKTKKNTRKKK